MKILNAFSLNMVEDWANIQTMPLSLKQARALIRHAEEIECYIGHEDTATIFGKKLKTKLEANRCDVKLKEGEVVIVAQYSGPRLPEGVTRLPKGAKIKFIAVMVGNQLADEGCGGYCISIQKPGELFSVETNSCSCNRNEINTKTQNWAFL